MNKVKPSFSRAGFVAAVACFSGLLLAQSAIAQQGGPRKPPQEALDACKSLSNGADCSFNAPSGTVSGTCAAPEGKPLACRPADAPDEGSRPQKQR
ncbi:MAG: hypothetical protein CVU19_08585 [Betaproteobacteria bacterium HGW-Betaproteobacteria-13]|jgi:hypothetical protein|uniref:DUF3551 domain-containing protein n=1 Tax=Parazoarcus communis TaxID=41977 RepID=A0A2U8H628_9RHOO|nr:hypothetical protein [Parazoarcus communis]AWI81113.1 hypothetical protein CEW87_18150 [Parazoarcus communis]PKO81140.1 MAG: hypothetical protein CVU19_08585 [Betaproteobacteria bacterium HGW-Betaproteobacteria-13]